MKCLKAQQVLKMGSQYFESRVRAPRVIMDPHLDISNVIASFCVQFLIVFSITVVEFTCPLHPEAISNNPNNCDGLKKILTTVLTWAIIHSPLYLEKIT